MMLTKANEEIAKRARELYESELRAMLEPVHMHEFVSIEPDSGDYFLGRTLSEAAGSLRAKYPDRLFHTMRVGHAAAIHLG